MNVFPPRESVYLYQLSSRYEIAGETGEQRTLVLTVVV